MDNSLCFESGCLFCGHGRVVLNLACTACEEMFGQDETGAVEVNAGLPLFLDCSCLT